MYVLYITWLFEWYVLDTVKKVMANFVIYIWEQTANSY